MRIIFLLLSVILFTTACKSDTTQDNSSAKLISDLLDKYPQLMLTYDNEKTYFNLTRVVKDKLYELEFELYNAVKSSASILVIKNQSGSYAMPLFREDQYDYWQTDTLFHKGLKTRVNTTFEQELKTAARQLKMDSQFFFARYLFEHVLLLRESYYPNPCSTSTGLPMQAMYQGEYVIIMTMYKSHPDSISVRGRFAETL